MKFRPILLLFLLASLCQNVSAETRDEHLIDSLKIELERAISNRDVSTARRIAKIDSIKGLRDAALTDREKYEKTWTIISEYETFICDSAEAYATQNLEYVKKNGWADEIDGCELHLAFDYARSGLFVQASKILDQYDYNKLSVSNKGLYCYSKLQFYDNLKKNSSSKKEQQEFEDQAIAYRDSLRKIWPQGSEENLKELAMRYVYEHRYKEALEILQPMYESKKTNTHGRAMHAMALATVYREMGEETKQIRYLLEAATIDVNLAVKENEALSWLSEIMFNRGENELAFDYLRVALDDAYFYNTHYKDAMVSRLYPVLERAYSMRIAQQQNRARGMLVIVVAVLLVLAIVTFFTWRQKKLIAQSRKKLNKKNNELTKLNVSLNEASTIKEQYVGYFMSQCAVYVNKLDEFRKQVNRKIKAGQVDDLYVLSSRPFEKELEELYANFDNAFLHLYPRFIDDFNQLLRPECKMKVEKGRLNTGLRIFALIRLGVSDTAQIAQFLHYSSQTIYNYKSKIKKMSDLEADEFEERVKRISKMNEN